MNIILRDMPKQKVQIDLWPFDIHGGFRGFQQVPKGLHYVATLHEQSYPSFWGFVQDETLVKVFDAETGSYHDADAETKATLQQMADSGAVNHRLIAFPQLAVPQWYRLTNYITPENFAQIPGIEALDIHLQHSNEDILAAYQWAFLQVIVAYPEHLNAHHMKVWLEWVRIAGATTSEFIAAHVRFYNVFLELLNLHLELLPSNYRTETEFIRKGAEAFGEKLQQVGDVELSVKAKQHQLFA